MNRAGEQILNLALEEDDAVHLDFHHRNVLACRGQLSAVIDCEGLRNGDRIFDLITLGFCLEVAKRTPQAERKLWEVVRAQRATPIIEAYIAHQALRQVDWSLRHRTPADTARWLRRADALLPR